MGVVFSKHIGRNLEVYIDDMIVKTSNGKSHVADLDDILESVRRYNMHLNAFKCSFGVQTGKFMGFMLTMRGIETSPYMCQTIINMKNPFHIK